MFELAGEKNNSNNSGIKSGKAYHFYSTEPTLILKLKNNELKPRLPLLKVVMINPGPIAIVENPQ